MGYENRCGGARTVDRSSVAVVLADLLDPDDRQPLTLEADDQTPRTVEVDGVLSRRGV
jgi:hypothetical protein